MGCEDPDDRAFEEEQEAEVGREPVPPGPEPVPDCCRADEHSQADEPEREVLQADVVGDAEVLEPDHVRLVLEASRAGFEKSKFAVVPIQRASSARAMRSARPPAARAVRRA